MKILLMEDDVLLNEIIEEHLLAQNYDVEVVFNGDDAEEIIYAQKFDLLLLDVNVPGTNGFELLKELRDKGIHTPAIFLTSLNMVDDVEKGFAAGCEDYIKKPFELKELNLRINNIKRLFKIESTKEITLAKNIILDIDNLVVINNGYKQHITQKELEVLQYLINQSNKAISIEELSSNVWSYDDAPSSATIRTYIKNIRKMIGEELIINLRGVGYRFNG